VCTPRLCCGGRTDSPGGEGDGGQYFGRREKYDCPLTVKYVLCGLTLLISENRKIKKPLQFLIANKLNEQYQNVQRRRLSTKIQYVAAYFFHIKMAEEKPVNNLSGND
jgi:hypothetical protein